jgi:hypothetical protein
MSEALKQRVIDFTEEVWHKGNLDALDQYIARDCVRHTSPGGSEGGRDVIGIEDARKSISAMRTAFPDIHYATDDILADGDGLSFAGPALAHTGVSFGASRLPESTLHLSASISIACATEKSLSAGRSAIRSAYRSNWGQYLHNRLVENS